MALVCHNAFSAVFDTIGYQTVRNVRLLPMIWVKLDIPFVCDLNGLLLASPIRKIFSADGTVAIAMPFIHVRSFLRDWAK